jgi:ABC-type branched-subunit amino acid transport system substrate-binding protein
MMLRLGACLSLTGSFAYFGNQAALALRTWQEDVEYEVRLIVEDDHSEPRLVAGALERLASGSDILLGPYSSTLMRAARAALPAESLLWNHGGAADDVQSGPPGRVISVLTPARRYAEPFIAWLLRECPDTPLVIIRGSGGFARLIASGAGALARQAGITLLARPPDHDQSEHGWALLCAGSFEEDVASVTRARASSRPPAVICAVAAGVRRFGSSVPDPNTVLGLAQWMPGAVASPQLGPVEEDFLASYRRLNGSLPDYPATQAAAAAALAVHCAQLAGSTSPGAVWLAACSLQVTTFYGAFAIDHRTGEQIGHETVLTRWQAGELSQLPGVS